MRQVIRGERILILDELDSHLHPANQRRLCDMVADLARERGFQVLISTHSGHVLYTLSSRGQLIWMSSGKAVDQPDKTATAYRRLELLPVTKT